MWSFGRGRRGERGGLRAGVVMRSGRETPGELEVKGNGFHLSGDAVVSGAYSNPEKEAKQDYVHPSPGDTPP